MGLPELRQWVQANADTETSPTWGLTLRQAIQQGHDSAVSEILNRPRAGISAGRGVLTATVFNGEFTLEMRSQLTNAERTALNDILASGEIDVSGAGISSRLASLGFPVTRPGSIAEQELGRPVTLDDIAAAINRTRKRIEQRLACEADGSISLAHYEDGIEVPAHRHPHPAGLRIDPTWASTALTEAQILRALEGRRP